MKRNGFHKIAQQHEKTATIMAAAYEDSCIVLKVVIPLLRVLLLVRGS